MVVKPNKIHNSFPDPNEIKQKYGESAELEVRSYLELLTNLQRRLQYEELSEFVSHINNPSLAISSINILPPRATPVFTKGKHF